MTLKQAIKEAVETENGHLMCRILDKLRDSGLDYFACAKMFEKHAGIDLHEFERLSILADYAESQEIENNC